MNYTIADVGRLLAAEVPELTTEFKDMTDDPRNYRVAFDRIRNALGFVPQYDLETGIREMLRGLEQNPELRQQHRVGQPGVARHEV